MANHSAPPQHPTIVRSVLFFSDRESKGEAAIVCDVEVPNNHIVNLVVFNHRGVPRAELNVPIVGAELGPAHAPTSRRWGWPTITPPGSKPMKAIGSGPVTNNATIQIDGAALALALEPTIALIKESNERVELAIAAAAKATAMVTELMAKLGETSVPTPTTPEMIEAGLSPPPVAPLAETEELAKPEPTSGE